MNTLPVIPWLVQGSATDTATLGPEWETVFARTSREAAVLWAESRGVLTFPLPFFVHVGPVAKCLRYGNGMPHFCKMFTFAAAQPTVSLTA